MKSMTIFFYIADEGICMSVVFCLASCMKSLTICFFFHTIQISFACLLFIHKV